MNKMIIYRVICLSTALNFSCSSDIEDIDYERKYDVTIHFINETSEYIKSSCWHFEDIPPFETFTFKEKGSVPLKKITINNFPTTFHTCNVMYVYGKTLKCENLIKRIKNYEERKELKPNGDTLIFEFTFRFTEERKRSAKGC